MKKGLFKAIFLGLLSVALVGCTFVVQKGRRSDIRKIDELTRQNEELARTKNILEDRLSPEIKGKEVSLAMMDKGLVITFVADVLFDSGKAVIKPESYAMLDKVAVVLNENVPQFNIGIEGHTDNQAIKLSGWKSNWELSTARALSVLHYLADKKGVAQDRLSAIGYGEFHPIASNDSRHGRQLNRRVEVVILPQITKIKEPKEISAPEPKEVLKSKENLK